MFSLVAGSFYCDLVEQRGSVCWPPCHVSNKFQSSQARYGISMIETMSGYAAVGHLKSKVAGNMRVFNFRKRNLGNWNVGNGYAPRLQGRVGPILNDFC